MADTGDQVGLVALGAHLAFARAETLLRPMDPDTRAAEIADIDSTIAEIDDETTLNLYTHSTAERDRRVLRSFDAYSLLPADDDDPEEAEDPSEEGP